MSGCSTGSDTASNSLALPAVQSYAVAVAVAEAYLELVRAATAGMVAVVLVDRAERGK